MKAVFQHKDLDRAVSATGRIAAGKSTIPIMSGILIAADANKATLTAGNNEMFMDYTIPCDVQLPGKALVSGRLLSDLVKKMPTNDIAMSLDAESNTLIVQSGKAIYKILTMKANEYPETEKAQTENSIEITGADLRDIFRLTSYAVAKKDIAKPLFTGIDIQFKEGVLSALGTDRQRAARKTMPFNSSSVGEIIIPPESLAEITRLVAPEERIHMGWGKGRVVFETDNLYLVCLSINGKFPDFDREKPKTPRSVVTLDRNELLDALDRISLIGAEFGQNYTYNTIVFAVGNNQVKLWSESGIKGKANEEIPADIQGESCKFAFNGFTILDFLKAIDNEKIIMTFPPTLAPVLLTPAGDDSYIYIASPLREDMYEKEAVNQ